MSFSFPLFFGEEWFPITWCQELQAAAHAPPWRPVAFV